MLVLITLKEHPKVILHFYINSLFSLAMENMFMVIQGFFFNLSEKIIYLSEA